MITFKHAVTGTCIVLLLRFLEKNGNWSVLTSASVNTLIHFSSQVRPRFARSGIDLEAVMQERHAAVGGGDPGSLDSDAVMKAAKTVVSRVQQGTRYSTVLSLNEAKLGPGSLLGQRAKPYEDMPGPKQLPFLGNAWRFLPFVGHYQLTKLDEVMASLQKQYGEIVRLGGLIGHPDLVFVFNPKEIEHVFKREEVLPHRPSMPSVKYYKQVMHKDFFGDDMGVVGVHGSKWDSFRSQVQQTMMQPNTAKKYLTPLNGITTEFIDRIEGCRSRGEPIPDFIEELYRWALECIGKVALDTRLGCLGNDISHGSEAQQMIESVKTFFANVAEVELRLPVWRVYSTPAWKTYIKAFDVFRLTCLKYIQEAMKNMEARNGTVDCRPDEDIPIVERILMKTKNPKIATVLALDLLLVGIDTTSVAATTILYHLAKNPEKQELLYQELHSLIPDPDELISEDIINKSTYLSACIKESLRLIGHGRLELLPDVWSIAATGIISGIYYGSYTDVMKPVIIGNGRSLQSDAEISGYVVPKGTHVIFPHYIVGNMPEYFSRPNTFLPERWLKQSHEGCPVSSKMHNFASLPFGYGRRTCLGRRFAEIELKILLSKIFRKYNVTYDGTIKYEVQSTYKPSHPVEFHFEKRNRD